MLTYLICSTPRVGSNLLCSLLNGTRVVGHPREYLCPHQIAEYGPQLCGFGAVRSAADLDRFLDAATQAFGSNGRFGIKAHYHQLQSVMQLGFDLTARFPARIVHMSRADVVGQALSLVRAAQTGAWTAKQREAREHSFQPEAIRSAIQRIQADNHGWESFFRRHDIEPYRLSYERLCADFEGELAKVLVHLEVDPATVDLGRAVASATSYFKTQRDGVTSEWRERYQEWVRRRAQLQHDAIVAARVPVAPSANTAAR